MQMGQGPERESGRPEFLAANERQNASCRYSEVQDTRGLAKIQQIHRRTKSYRSALIRIREKTSEDRGVLTLASTSLPPPVTG